MKALYYSFSVFIVLLASCAKKENPKPSAELLKEPEAVVETPAKDGLTLIKSSDCLTCHKDNEKLIGPSYQQIADKYPNSPETVELLADKIVKGGQGVWGDVPMAPHPNISHEDAKQMAKYILAMKK